MTNVRSTIIALLLIAMAALGAVSLAASMGRNPPALSTLPSDQPLLVAPTEGTTDFAVQTAVKLEVSSPRELRLGRSGIVTALADGLQPLDTGDIVLEVNGDVVIGYVSERPLHRTLEEGSQGDDVVILQEVLAEMLDEAISVDGSFGTETAEAVARIRTEYQLEDGRAIGPEQLLWLGSEPFEVVTAEVAVGQQVELGETVAVGLPTQIEASLVSIPRASALWANKGVGELVLSIGGRDIPVNPEGLIAPSSARELYADLGEVEAEPAVIALASPRRIVEIPASALVTDGTRSCVLDANGASTSVDVVDVVLGRALLAVAPLPDLVLVLPERVDC